MPFNQNTNAPFVPPVIPESAPAKYFQELKLRKAKQMLVGTSQSVKEISFFLGFQSTEYFFSFFKKRTGLTPLEYRSFGREE